MSFTSMTDVQRQVRYGWDKEPWVDPTNPDGQRFATGGEIRFGRTVIQRNFAPRPSCIPSPDPKSWVEYHDSEMPGANPIERHRVHRNFGLFKPRPWGTFAPDPEFVRSEPNPILVSFRESNVTDPNKWLEFIRVDRELESWSGEQVAEAIKVLTKLRDVMEASNV